MPHVDNREKQKEKERSLTDFYPNASIVAVVRRAKTAPVSAKRLGERTAGRERVIDATRDTRSFEEQANVSRTHAIDENDVRW